MSKTFTNCPKCKSDCLDYRQDSSILCAICMTVIKNAPKLDPTTAQDAGDVLLQFYHALGWNGLDMVEPCKVRTTNTVYMRLYDAMMEKCPDALTVGVVMVNKAPGVDEDIPAGKVCLLKGWVTNAT